MPNRLTTLAAAVAIAGCATIPPNTPGAGSGKTYTPIIDMRGVEQGRYLVDLDSCRSSAAMVDAEREQLMGFIGGALIGAAIGASFGGNARTIDQSATAGGLSGGVRAGGRALGKQEIIMGNCMAARGYRVIDGTANVSYTVQAAPSGQLSPFSAPQGPQTAPSTAPPRIPEPVIQQAATVAPTGQDAFNAEKLGRSMACADNTVSAVLVGKGPGYESYSMKCINGETLLIRCEFGNCRALR